MQLKSTTKYPEFKALLDSMDAENVDYEHYLTSVMANVIRRQKGERFTLNEHLRGLIYSLLSSQRPWEGIDANRAQIDTIFHDFDINYVENADPAALASQIKSIKCGNLTINRQMRYLKYDINLFKSIASEYGSVDNFLDAHTPEELVRLLSDYKSKYKLKGCSNALTSLYLKNMGILIEKPDTHTRRIIGMWGYSSNSPKDATIEEVHQVCQDIARAYGLSVVEVDLIIWRGGESGVAYGR